MIIGLVIAYGHVLFWLEIFGVFAKRGWTKRILLLLSACLAVFPSLYAMCDASIDKTPIKYTLPLAIGYFIVSIIAILNYRKMLKEGKEVHFKAGEWEIVDDVLWLVPTYLGKPMLRRCIHGQDLVIMNVQLTADPKTSEFCALVIPDKNNEGVYSATDYWYVQKTPIFKRIIQILTVSAALALPALIAWAVAESGGIPLRDDIPQYGMFAGAIGIIVFGFNAQLAWDSEKESIKVWKGICLALVFMMIMSMLVSWLPY